MSKPKTQHTPRNHDHSKDVGLHVLRDAVVQATELLSTVNELTARLEELKATIRTLAVPLIASGENNIEIETDAGTCMVALVRDKLALVEGFDPEVLRHTMRERDWNVFFLMKPALRSTATDTWLVLNKAQRRALGDPPPFVLVPGVPQVRLAR